MKIRCTLSTIDKAIAELDKYEKSLKQKNQQMLDKIADAGVSEAQYRFMYAEYDGDYTISVDKEMGDESTMYVTATGNAVAFIEFGTGAYYPDEHPNATEDWMRHGSWSTSAYGKGHWDAPHGWWYEVEEHVYRNTFGNPANMCMYNAAKVMRDKEVNIAREVFGT